MDIEKAVKSMQIKIEELSKENGELKARIAENEKSILKVKKTVELIRKALSDSIRILRESFREFIDKDKKGHDK